MLVSNWRLFLSRVTGLVLAGCLATGCGLAGDGGCKSVYDGTYIGQFVYEWSNLNDGSSGTDGFNLTLVFECKSKSSSTIELGVVEATVDDPYFACQVGGCTPEPGWSWANLPADPPTTPSNQSQAHHGIQVGFPNGARIETVRQAGFMTVTTSAMILSNAPLCQAQDPFQCWGAGASNSGENFPSNDIYMTRGVSWSLTKSAL